MKTRLMAIDQYGAHFILKTSNPRKELLEYFGKKHSDKIYMDYKDRTTKHVGYIIAGHWLTIYKIEPWEKPAN